jgi:hypothetical protein
MDELGGLNLKQRLRCGLRGRLLEWRFWTSSREEWENRGAHPDRPISADSLVYA